MFQWMIKQYGLQGKWGGPDGFGTIPINFEGCWSIGDFTQECLDERF